MKVKLFLGFNLLTVKNLKLNCKSYLQSSNLDVRSYFSNWNSILLGLLRVY